MSTEVKVGDEIKLSFSLYNLSTTRNYKVTRVSQHFFYIEENNQEYSFTQSDILHGYISHIPNAGITLPTGYSVAMSSNNNNVKDVDALFGIYNSGDYWGSSETETVKIKPKNTCECGQSKVVGHEGDNWEQHSQWCPTYKEGKLNVRK